MLLTQLAVHNNDDGSGFQMNVDPQHLPILFFANELPPIGGIDDAVFITMSLDLLKRIPPNRVIQLYDRGHHPGVLGNLVRLAMHGTLPAIPNHAVLFGQPIALSWQPVGKPGERKEAGTAGCAWGMPFQIIAYHPFGADNPAPAGCPDGTMAYSLTSSILSSTRTGRPLHITLTTGKIYCRGTGVIEQDGYPALLNFVGKGGQRITVMDQLLRRLVVEG